MPDAICRNSVYWAGAIFTKDPIIKVQRRGFFQFYTQLLIRKLKLRWLSVVPCQSTGVRRILKFVLGLVTFSASPCRKIGGIPSGLGYLCS